MQSLQITAGVTPAVAAVVLCHDIKFIERNIELLETLQCVGSTTN